MAAKSRLLQSTLLEFSRTTRELSALEQKLALLKVEGSPRKTGQASPSKAAESAATTGEASAATPQPPHKVNLSSQFDGASATGVASAIQQAALTIVLDESAAELEIQVENMRADLDRLRRAEVLAAQKHSGCRDGLQEAWDKLVNLRTHISLFKTSIEEATLEQLAANKKAAGGDGSAAAASAATAAAAAAGVGAARGSAGLAIREKIALKETLKGPSACLPLAVCLPP